MDINESALRNDLAILLNMLPLLVDEENSGPYPYFNKLTNDILNGRNIGKSYGKKIKTYLSKKFRNALKIHSYNADGVAEAYDGAIDSIIRLMGEIGMKDLLQYYSENKAEFSNERMNAFIEDNRNVMREIMKNIESRGSDNMSLFALQTAYQRAFEKLYLPSYEGMMKIFSGLPNKRAYPETESILCLTHTIMVEGSMKSDFRNLRNKLAHADYKQKDGYIQIEWENGESVHFGVDVMIRYLMGMSLKCIPMLYVCNLFMLLDVYERLIEKKA